ncbi:MAG: hypothetical protein ACKVYV_12715 [Limisphaerales bacterium]
MDSILPEHERLLRLLALKRHEVPPPGYFDRFADRVVLHIKAGQVPAPEPWWARLREWLVTEPALAGSYAMLVTGGLFFALSVYHLSDRGASPGLISPHHFGAVAAMPGPATDAAAKRDLEKIQFRLQPEVVTNRTNPRTGR